MKICKIIIIMVCFMLLGFVCGCTGANENENPNEQIKVYDEGGQATMSDDNEYPVLTQEKALALAEQASIKFWYIFDHGIYGLSEDERIAVYNNKPYPDNEVSPYGYSESINTMEKLQKYLAEVFTEESIPYAIDYYGIVEYEGEIFGEDSGLGDGSDWSEAEVISLNQEGNFVFATFDISFEYLDLSGRTDLMTKQITYKFVDGTGWRIDTTDMETFI